MKSIWMLTAVLVMACMCCAADDTPAAKAQTESGFKNPPGGTEPVTMEQMIQKREELFRKATAILDSFVGTYSGEVEIDGVKQIAELTLQPKFMNDFYYQGLYSLKTEDGTTVYEAFIIFSYNTGAMTYLFFYFGNDGYIRNYMGPYSDAAIVVQSPFPGGMESIRWSLQEDGILKQEVWNPSRSTENHGKSNPDRVILFKKTK